MKKIMNFIIIVVIVIIMCLILWYNFNGKSDDNTIKNPPDNLIKNVETAEIKIDDLSSSTVTLENGKVTLDNFVFQKKDEDNYNLSIKVNNNSKEMIDLTNYNICFYGDGEDLIISVKGTTLGKIDVNEIVAASINISADLANVQRIKFVKGE